MKLLSLQPEWAAVEEEWVGPDPPLMFRPLLRLVQNHRKDFRYRVSVPCLYIVTFYCSPAKINWLDPHFFGLVMPLVGSVQGYVERLISGQTSNPS